WVECGAFPRPEGRPVAVGNPPRGPFEARQRYLTLTRREPCKMRSARNRVGNPAGPAPAYVSSMKRNAKFPRNIGVRSSLTIRSPYAIRNFAMAHSLLSADRFTHLKILTVALVAGIVFVVVGIAANVSDFETAGALMQDQPVLKAGKSTIFTTRYDTQIR